MTSCALQSIGHRVCSVLGSCLQFQRHSIIVMKDLLVIILLFATLTDSKGQSKLDTSNYVLFKTMDSAPQVFDSRFEITSLTKSEIIKLENLLTKNIVEYNTSKKIKCDSLIKIKTENILNFCNPIKLSKYKRQLIAVVNFKGEKEVWVNCFRPSPAFNPTDWRKRIISVDGGGEYFFNVIVNLTTNKFQDLKVNGPF